jgi:hypothetical protein
VVKVLQRSLFKAPVHEHYGTGIASGLADRPGYAVGGRVNLKVGGDPEREEKGKNTLEGFYKEAPETLANGLRNAMVTEYLTNLESIKGLDEAGKKNYFNNFVNSWYDTLPPDIVNFIKEGAKEGGSPQAKELFQAIKNELKETFNQLPTFEKNIYFKSIENNGQAFPNFQTELEGFNNYYGGNLDELSKITGIDITPGTTKETEEKQVVEGDLTIAPPPRPDPRPEGLAALDRTSPQFRKEYVDYLQQLQEETGLADRRRREAVEAGFFNLGAADPVQPGESLIQAGIRAFRDPMANLRAQEAVQAENIYTRGADVLDEALAPSDSANVQLIERIIATGVPEAQAVDIVTGLSTAKAAQLEDILKNDRLFNNVIIPLVQGDPENNIPGMTLPDAIKQVTGIPLLQTAEDIVAQQNLTNPTITATTLQGMEEAKDGGRIGFQQGGEAISEAVVDRAMQPTGINAGSPSISPMSYDELREKLPDYISDDVVKLLAENPMALMELAQAQTDRDLRAFEKKYKVDVTMPQAESEVDYTGAV